MKTLFSILAGLCGVMLFIVALINILGGKGSFDDWEMLIYPFLMGAYCIYKRCTMGRKRPEEHDAAEQEGGETAAGKDSVL